MEQVVAKQRIKVATKDHVLISKLHLRLHRRDASRKIQGVLGEAFVQCTFGLIFYLIKIIARPTILGGREA